MSHVADFALGPLLAILAPFHNNLIPENVTTSLTKFQGQHTVSTSAFSPPFDLYPRNITAWLDTDISIGGEAFNETVIGGPSMSSSSFNPGVIQWNAGAGVGFITVSNDIASLRRDRGSNETAVTEPLTDVPLSYMRQRQQLHVRLPRASSTSPTRSAILPRSSHFWSRHFGTS